jgi:hypothetical protein
MEARRRKARALWLRHSQSFASRRQRPSQAKVRSTIQRLGSATKPVVRSDRLTISTLTRARIRFTELRSLVAAVGIELDQERKGAEQAGHQQHAAVAVLDVGGVDDRVHQQALRIDEDVALPALDLFAWELSGILCAGPV